MKPLDKTALAALAAVPRVQLGCWPTPVQAMKGMEKETGRTGLYMKRDDLNGVGPGGNKVRPLETLLARALAQGADTVVASGPAQSNLCTLAACCAKRLGMDAVLVHNAPRPEHPVGNELLNGLLGARTVYLGPGTDEWQRADRVTRVEAELRAEGRHPYTVLLGGSTGLGAIGYYPIVPELYETCRAQGLDIRHLFVPGGNGGVAAGVVYANALLGLPFEIHVISVEDETPVLTGHMERIIAEAQAETGLAMPMPLSRACRITDAYMGGGWSRNTPESQAMVPRFAALEGVFLENVYTSKVLVALEDQARKGELTGGLCFLHTGGFGSLFAQY